MNDDQNNVTRVNFGGTPFREVGNLQTDIETAINKYRGIISKAEAIGVLEIIKNNIYDED